MCGISGAADHDERRAARRVRALNEMQEHRGPDHTAMVRKGTFTLGNTRLAIMDPTPEGNQPFASVDGRYVCVFNGEIYNYRELISEFDLRLSTSCDGAVIPELWSRLGPSCLRLMRGMYGIALVDTVEDTLTLCRDPFGIKPLHYRLLDDSTLVFASEVRTLARIETRPAVSEAAIASFLHLGSVPSDRSPFDGVEAVPPNSAVGVTSNLGLTTTRIHCGPRPLTRFDEPGVAPELGESFCESVDLHLRSDVPTALLLSAGVDSTAIAAAARRGGHTLHCLTVGGAGAADEAQVAAKTAARYGHEHAVVPAVLEPADVELFFGAMQRPSTDGLNTFLVCRAVRDHGYRVALSGLGGDEALGGYPFYDVLPWLAVARGMQKLPSRLTAVVRSLGDSRRAEKIRRLIGPDGPRTASELDLLQRQIFAPDQVQQLCGSPPNALSGDEDQASSFEALVDAELRHYLQPTLLADADAFSMCFSVELRVPFVDRPYFVSAVSPMADGRRAPGKAALADALGDDYLRALTRERKRGFTVPVADWLESGALKVALDALEDRLAPVWDYLDRDRVRSMVDPKAPGRWIERWAIAALNGWLESVGSDELTPTN